MRKSNKCNNHNTFKDTPNPNKCNPDWEMNKKNIQPAVFTQQVPPQVCAVVKNWFQPLRNNFRLRIKKQKKGSTKDMKGIHANKTSQIMITIKVMNKMPGKNTDKDYGKKTRRNITIKQASWFTVTAASKTQMASTLTSMATTRMVASTTNKTCTIHQPPHTPKNQITKNQVTRSQATKKMILTRNTITPKARQ